MGVGKSNAQGSGLPNDSIYGIIGRMMNWLLAIIGFIGVIGFVIAGILYLTSAGNEEQIETARRLCSGPSSGSSSHSSALSLSEPWKLCLAAAQAVPHTSFSRKNGAETILHKNHPATTGWFLFVIYPVREKPLQGGSERSLTGFIPSPANGGFPYS